MSLQQDSFFQVSQAFPNQAKVKGLGGDTFAQDAPHSLNQLFMPGGDDNLPTLNERAAQ